MEQKEDTQVDDSPYVKEAVESAISKLNERLEVDPSKKDRVAIDAAVLQAATEAFRQGIIACQSQFETELRPRLRETGLADVPWLDVRPNVRRYDPWAERYGGAAADG
jgi:hypothetical protein